MKTYLIMLALLPILLSCASRPQYNNYLELNEAQYNKFIKKKATNTKAYRGFYNLFDAWVFPFTQVTQNHYFNRWADFRQWPHDTYQVEKEKFSSKFVNNALFFVDFYAVDKKYNKLHIDSSIWKIYLHLDNQRILGKINKHPLSQPEVKSLFYLHSPFYKPYIAQFNLPMEDLKAKKYKLVLTSSYVTKVIYENKGYLQD